MIYNNDLAIVENSNLRLHIDRSNESVAAPDSQAGTISISGTAVTGSGTSFNSSMIGKYIIVGVTDYLITAVADATHMTIADIDSSTVASTAWKLSAGHTCLNRSAGKSGYILAVIGGMDGTSADLLEANTRFRLDQELGSSLAWSGTEDFFLGSFYWEQPSRSQEGGIVCYDITNSKFTAYRIFADFPIKYVDGIKAVQPNTSTGSVQYNWTTYYYEYIS